MEIALIAHDKKKADMLKLVNENKNILNKHTLIATGTTGGMIEEKAGLAVKRFITNRS